MKGGCSRRWRCRGAPADRGPGSRSASTGRTRARGPPCERRRRCRCAARRTARGRCARPRTRRASARMRRASAPSRASAARAGRRGCRGGRRRRYRRRRRRDPGAGREDLLQQGDRGADGAVPSPRDSIPEGLNRAAADVGVPHRHRERPACRAIGWQAVRGRVGHPDGSDRAPPAPERGEIPARSGAGPRHGPRGTAAQVQALPPHFAQVPLRAPVRLIP